VACDNNRRRSEMPRVAGHDVIPADRIELIVTPCA
jgi:hypothetical protein